MIFWRFFHKYFWVISAYKDPVENQHVRKILEKFVTAFFIVTLGALWYCTKCFVKANQYRIVIYDVLGNQVDIDGVRTSFNTHKVANSFISEYQNRFSQYTFSISTEMPIIKRNWLFENLKKN